MMTESPQKNPASTALVILAVLAVLYTLYFARTFLIPIAISSLLAFVLSPAVRFLTRLRIPEWLGAAIVVLSLVGVIVLSAYQLAGPVQAWTAEAPATLAKAEREIKKLLRPLERFTKTAERVEEATEAAAGPGDKPAEVVVRGPTLGARLFGSTQRFVAYLLQVLLLLYFLLAAGNLFLEKAIKVLPTFQDKKKAVRIARETETSISVYLLANLGINMVEGLMVGGAMWALGMPAPFLWALLTVFFEFIPYVGALVMVVLLSIVALATFDNIGQILLVPAAFLLANLIQANIVTTLVLGRRLALNPVALFVGLAFWFWIWGIAGAFIGVPLLAIFKIICDNIESLAPVGEFLGARSEPAQSPALPADQAAPSG
jgi:predicted PurR-regulated permease PerM